MKRFLLDSSAYDEIDLDNIDADIELFTSALQQRELTNTNDKRKKTHLIKKYEYAHGASIPKTKYIEYHPDDTKTKWMKSDRELPTESFILDVSPLDAAKLGSAEVYQDIRDYMNSIDDSKDHSFDAQIGEVALVNNMVLVSDDALLRKAVNKLGGRAIEVSVFNNEYCSLKDEEE